MCKLKTENLKNIQGFEFFFGLWSQNKKINLDYSSIEIQGNYCFLDTKNYFLMSSLFEKCGDKKSLICICTSKSENENIEAMLFRGYILEPPIHSLSKKDDVLTYWNNDTKCIHNGIFSAACIKNSGKTLELITDAFGIGGLYYRKTGSTIWFSTSPRFLQFADDEPDMIAWRSLMQSSFICGDRSLSSQVSRVPPGTVIRFEDGKETRTRWFNYSSLPDGTSSIDSKAVETVEQSFRSAMERCLKLKEEEVFLPLSSGYDSRRILGDLLDREIAFHFFTVSLIGEDGSDPDGVISTRIASELGFSHELFPWPSVYEIIKNEQVRRECLAHESREHAWFLPAWKKPDRTTLWFDGLCGDTLGHSGLKISGIGGQGPTTPEILKNSLFTRVFDSVLNISYWPSVEEVQSDFVDYLRFLPKSHNFVDLAMILHRARRAVSISSQQFCRPGMVVVYPYLGLDYVRNVLNFSPFDRYANSLQRLCLRRFHPKIFACYDKESAQPVREVPQKNANATIKPSLSQQYAHCLHGIKMWELSKMIKSKRNLQLLHLKYINKQSERPVWWLKPLLEMLDWKYRKPVFIESSH